ncbi:MAG: tetratricopeptide repeat protein [Treponematales bacterium]
MNADSHSNGENEAGEPVDIAEMSQRGYRFLRENKNHEAADCFNQILAAYPENSYALVGMGDIERRQNRFQEAVVFYERCLALYPENGYALFGVADCYKFLNEYPKAVKAWERYLRLDNGNITVLTRAADAYRKMRNFKRSKEMYDLVLEIDRQNGYALTGLGYLHFDFKEYEKALDYGKAMLAINGDNADVRLFTLMGNCHRKLKSFQEGILCFEKALKREPGNFYALFGLADCYRGLNRHGDSLKYWRLILEQDPGNKVILTRAADAYRSMGDNDKAKAHYEAALSIEFDSYAARGLALVRKAQGDYEKAAESFKGLIKQEPKDFRLRLELADCLLKMGDKTGTRETLEDFLRGGNRSAAVSALLEKIKT